MKNYLMFALLLCATASVAFGQFGVADPQSDTTIVCPDDECHVAPYFMGEGGFVGKLAAGVDEVTFVVECGIVNTTGTAQADSGGIVAQLLDSANGLACAAGGMIEIHGLEDGGWYWITDVDNSAVASLVAKDALGNDMVMPTNPGSADITLTSGKSSTMLKQASTGRVGILHHVLPEPTAAPPAVCMPQYAASWNQYYQQQHDCMLGDGGTVIHLTGPSDIINARSTITNNTVVRPTSGTKDVIFTLWGNGSGHISTAAGADRGWSASNNTTAALKGWRIATAGGNVPTPFDVPSDAVLAAIVGSPQASLASANVELMPPGTTTTPPAKTPMPPGGANPADPPVEDGNTVRRELGHTDGDGTPDCTQRLGSDLSGDAIVYFQAADGGDDIAIVADGTQSPTASADDAAVANWAKNYNDSVSTDRLLKLIRLFHTGSDPNDDSDDGYHSTYPAVACEMVPGTGPGTTQAYNGSLKISASRNHCSSSANHPVDVSLGITLAGVAGANPDTKPAFVRSVRAGGINYAATTSLRILCPSASPSKGQELTPDPFPTGE